MNRRRLVAVASISLVSLAACSSAEDKPATSASAALGAVQSPTGTFDASNAGAAFARYDSDKTTSNGLGGAAGAGGGGGSSTTQSLHILAGSVQTSSCSEGASCACDGGGSFSFARQSTDYGPAIQASFDACVFEGGSFTGDMLLLASNKPLLSSDDALLEGAPPAAAGEQSLLLAADGTFARGKDQVHAELVFLRERSVDYVAVEVADGKIVIGVRETDGAAIVRAKGSTWTCHRDATSSYACEEQSTGERIDASASNDGAPSTSGDAKTSS